MNLYTSFPAQVIQVAKCHLRNEYRRWETASCQVCCSQHYSLDIKSRCPGTKKWRCCFLTDKEWRKKLNIQKPSGDSNLKLKLIQVFFDAWICMFDAWNKVKHIMPNGGGLMVIYHDYHHKKIEKNISLDKSQEGGFEQLHEVQV